MRVARPGRHNTGTITARFLPCISRFIPTQDAHGTHTATPHTRFAGSVRAIEGRDSALLSAHSPVVSSSPSAMLRFCTAAPLAPLPRLSSRAVSTQVRACARAGARASVHQCASTSVRQYISASVLSCTRATAPRRRRRARQGRQDWWRRRVARYLLVAVDEDLLTLLTTNY